MSTSKLTEVPPLLRDALAVHQADFANRELYLGDKVRQPYQQAFRRLQDLIQGHFFQHYAWSVDPKSKQSVWDLQTARQVKTEDVVAGWVEEALIAAEEPALEDIDEALGNWAEDAYTYGLWFLAIGGISTEAARVPERAWFKRLLLSAGFAGLSYEARLRAWAATVAQRTQKFLRAGIVGGWTLNDTMAPLTGIFAQTVRSVESLATHELHRAGIIGRQHAEQPYQGQLFGSVWVTRDDPFVCKHICAPRHLTITDLKPGDDSHPGCRCQLVSIPVDFAGRPIDYVGFLQSLGRR